MAENTRKNRERLAAMVVDGMEVEELMQAVRDSLCSDDRSLDAVFQEDWENQYGDLDE